jgi:hypothetical protein
LQATKTRLFLDPETGEVVLRDSELGRFIGCKVDENALQPPVQFIRIPIPRLAIVELAPEGVSRALSFKTLPAIHNNSGPPTVSDA